MKKQKWLAILVAVAMVCMMLPMTTLAAGTGTITVGDTSFSSLQDAIKNADAEAELVLNGEVTVENEITVTKPITIKGGMVKRAAGYTGVMINISDSGALVIDGTAIDGGAGESITSAKAMILVNGTLTLNSGLLQNNNNTYGSGSYFGGALFINKTGTFVMNGGTIMGNTAKTGGAVHSIGQIMMNGGTIKNNTTTAGRGGGIAIESRFNTAAGDSMPSLTVTGGEIISNTSASAGGGISADCNLDLRNLKIADNIATLGGGIYLQAANGEASSVVANLINCEIIDNTATSKYGGGIWCSNKLVVTGGTISGNTSMNQGGGIYGSGIFELEDVSITNNTSAAGGGIFSCASSNYPNGGACTIGTGTVISNNTASTSSGGGVCVWSNNELVIDEGAVISNNVAAKGGAGVEVNFAKATINGGTFEGNTVAGEERNVCSSEEGTIGGAALTAAIVDADNNVHIWFSDVESAQNAASPTDIVKDFSETIIPGKEYFEVTYDYNDGVTPKLIKSYQKGSTITEFPSATRDGYVLDGWFTADDIKIDNTHVVNVAEILTAKWSSAPIPHTHDAVKTDANDATCAKDGNIAYWYCEGCGKYFSDAGCTTEITLDDTVIKATGVHSYADGKCTVCGEADPNYVPTEPTPTPDPTDTPNPTPTPAPTDKPNTEVPKTGDNSNMMLWGLLLLVAGAGIAGVVVYGRKRATK